MKRSLWILLAATLIGMAFADEKELPTLSLDSSESFSLDFESEPLVYSSKQQESIPWLGLWFQDTDTLEQVLEGAGVRIFAVAPLGPAYKAGLRKDDVVTHWNEEEITDADALRVRINALKIGEEATLTLQRNKATQKLKIKAEDRANYPSWKEWQPYLPTFEVADEVNALFQEHDDELKAMKAKFDQAEKASLREAKKPTDGSSDDSSEE